ncbi:hypothetical protein FN846DRAFT_731264 [Sphaerosporella brunnea]|uniref:HypA-like protein n=1 Tax=Sphaerosporella brunnea TaxID=1250544 RepID=A0A5J5EXJ7_9PEZI|nr:hypothetical protein FN846DRAFT_731264 [Sphaerosporella brunnea]
MSNDNPIRLTAATTGICNLPGITPASANAVSERLSENHRTHHIFFDQRGRHNHLVHNLLAIYDLGAPASVINDSYRRESSYQRDLSAVAPPSSPSKVDLSDPAQWKEYLGNPAAYGIFLEYFTKEIEKYGYETVVNKTLFDRSEKADDMLVRLFSGLTHPFIHVGYGLEFRQPAIVAEGLSMAAAQEAWFREFLISAEKKSQADQGDTTLVGLINEIQGNEKLRLAAQWEEGNKIKKMLQRALEEMLSYASRYKVPAEELQEKMAESINAVALFTAAAQREDKEIKIDFFYMHSHNSSLFLPVYLKQDWISEANKVRLLEWKTRINLAFYASQRAPELRIDEIRNYVPKEKPETNPWLNIIDRALKVKDDGHTAKFVRACIVGEKTCAPYQEHEDKGFVVRDDMWIKIAQMCIDSVEAEGEHWAMGVGFDEAWEKYGPKEQY